MPKNALRGLSIILGVLFLYGCASTKNVEVRRYTEIRDRIDQNMDEGNAGYLAGTPQPEDRSGIRKTRKIYVLEVSQGVEGEGTEDVVVEDNDMSDMSMDESDYGEDLQEDMEEPMDDQMMMEETSSASMQETSKPATFVEYTVQKDDTLQKISKKFYDSYSKWPKIYEVNKDVISDPDRIKPGIVIQVPTE